MNLQKIHQKEWVPRLGSKEKQVELICTMWVGELSPYRGTYLFTIVEFTQVISVNDFFFFLFCGT